jgi:AcrR family transcriptional regulator
MAGSRREDVLQAAAKLFSEQGFHAVGMRAIAQEVGVRGSSLYHYFPSKVDLLQAIAVDATRTFIEKQLANLNPHPSYSSRIGQLVYDHVVYFHEHRDEEAVGLRELQELRKQRPEKYVELQSLRRMYQNELERMIREGQEKGEFRCRDPHMTTLAILGMVNAVNDWYRPHRDGPIESVADEYAAIVVEKVLGSSL